MRQRRRAARRVLAVALTFGVPLLTIGVVADARAQASLEFLTLAWNAPASCPTDAEVLEQIAILLANRPTDRSPVAAHIDVVNLPTRRWQGAVSVETRDGHRDRTFEAESCDGVAAAAALIVALAVEGGAPRVAPRARPPAPPAAVVERPNPPAVVDDRAPTWMVIAIGAVADGGAMPSGPAGGGELVLGWSPAMSTWRLRLTGGAAYFPDQFAMSSPGVGAMVTLFAGSLRACASRMFDPFEVGPCLGAELDRMHATGVGPAGQLDSQSATSIWGAGLGGVFASWTLVPPLALVIHGEMVLAPVQHRFVFQPGPVPVYSPSRVAARGAIGLELRF